MNKLIAAAVVVLMWTAPAIAEDDPLSAERHGIWFFAVHPSEERIDGVRTTPAAQALDTLTAAVDRLMAGAPAMATRVSALRQQGQIQIIYDAKHPQNTLTSVNVASYFPDYYDPAAGKRDFVVLVGRTGIQWSIDELAATMAHELAGHATQDMEGRLEGMRELDIECEAYLVEEQAKQQLGVDKTTREAIAFRNATDNYWCDDFRRFTIAEKMPAAAEWDELNPNVPVLLHAFDLYLKSLRN